ncbi:MAG: bacillithiol biosynthesis cysteine-adding enzyme BshC [Ignavibacteriales bacterium]|nr:MAG: bacillithiol biosynthesis cysteine-adding enzyme BshC [Ignavibacteriales bacterium]
MFINFSDIPGHHNLFLDYLYEFDNVKHFYKNDFRNKEAYLSVFRKVSEKFDEFRPELVNIIQEQYSAFKPSHKTEKNISLLKSKKTLAVVTGQQLGLFGGPLYTLYKIITTIKLSQYLSERYDEYQFVPIFWLEGDDHDFNEVRYFNLISDNNELAKYTYEEQMEDEDNKGSVGRLKFNEKLNSVFDELTTKTRKTEFTEALMEKLKSSYTEKETFKSAFTKLLYSLFDEYGLVIFDPQHKKIKERLIPIFKKEITDFRTHTEKLVNVSAHLEETYHAQVKVRPVNLFYANEEGRYLIEPVENEFRLKRKRKRFTYEELINTIETEPEAFSPNVLLRPICQDYVLPTAFYVGGPSEIAYFAQVMPLYDFYSIEAPIIYPRSSATLLEKNINSILEKFSLTVKDVFNDPDKLKNQVVGTLSDSTIDEIFNSTFQQFELAFDQLKEKLFELDKTISDSSTRYKQKVINYIEELKAKSLEAQKKKFEVTLRQIDKISVNVFPGGNLQEREINFIHFANRYGDNFLKLVFDELAINKFEHQLINL